MRLTILLAATVMLSGCQVEQQVTNNKSAKLPAEEPAVPGPKDADQNPSPARLVDRGCEEASAVEWKLYDSVGGEQPVCTLLSESSAKAVVLLPVDYTCGTCLDHLMKARAELKKLSGVTVAMIARAGTSHPEALELLAATADDKALLYVDKDGHFAARLAARGFDWNDPVSYAFSMSAGMYARIDGSSFFEAMKDRFKLSPPQAEKPFSWDGLSNQGHGEWTVE